MSRRGGDGDPFIGTGLLFSRLLAVAQFESKFDVDRCWVLAQRSPVCVVVGVRLVVGSGGMTTAGFRSSGSEARDPKGRGVIMGWARPARTRARASAI
jgi:hypothetical protein